MEVLALLVFLFSAAAMLFLVAFMAAGVVFCVWLIVWQWKNPAPPADSSS